MSNINRVHGTPQTPQTDESSEVQRGQKGQHGKSSRGIADSPTTLERAEVSNDPFSKDPAHHAQGRPFTDAFFSSGKCAGKTFHR